VLNELVQTMAYLSLVPWPLMIGCLFIKSRCWLHPWSYQPVIPRQT